ncbi:MAG TPA: adenosine deaminase [Anaerolineae bacterium]|nr:adenosine deaminase [Anaerolineae bacterium]
MTDRYPLYTITSVTDELIQRLRVMPKIELHVHLEGATDAATVWELARRNHVSLPAATLEEWRSLYTFRDFNHFLEIYLRATGCMQTPADFAFMTEQFLKRQAQHNIKYCEVFLSASYLLDKFPQDEIIAALREGTGRGEAAYGTQLRFIPDFTRNLPESAPRVLDFALRGQEHGIFIGLGMGGQEVGFPPELFTEIYAEARRQGLHVVAHAGETEGPPSIWGAILSLQVERIGHGVRALEDPQLVEHLHQTQIPLEVSPYSNYRLKVVPIDQPHPIRALLDQGVYVTVNTDDPAMFSTDLTSEYVLLARQGFSWDELWQLNLNALEASFLSAEAKALCRAEWQAFAKTHSWGRQ